MPDGEGCAVPAAGRCGGADCAETDREDAGGPVERSELLPGPAAAAPAAAPHRRRGLRRAAAAAALTAASLGGAGLVLRRKAVRRCREDATGWPLVSLAETVRGDADGLARLQEAIGKEDAMHKWLAAAEEAATLSEAAHGRVEAEVRAAMDQAMAANDSAGAKRTVDRAMGQALRRWRDKRQALRSFLSGGGGNATGAANASAAAPPTTPDPDPIRQARTASCVVDVLQATTQLAASAVNINDAVTTCLTLRAKGKTCALNIVALFVSVSTVGSALAAAATLCADTLMLSAEDLCAASVLAIISLLPQVGAAAFLTSEACKPLAGAPAPGKGQEAVAQPQAGVAPAGTTASNARLDADLEEDGEEEEESAFGSNGSARRLSAGASPRRLFIGGGKGATDTFCAIDVSSTAWFLAQAGLSLNAAANKRAGALCPPVASSPLLNSSDPKSRSRAYRWSQAACTVAVSDVIFAFTAAVFFIEIAFVHCANSMNLHALCAAGLTGLVSNFAGTSETGSALWLQCEQYRHLRTPAGGAGAAAAGASTSAPPPANGSAAAGDPPGLRAFLQRLTLTLGGAGSIARRLARSGAEAGVEELKRRFDSPAAAWQSIGFDVTDPDAEWHRAYQAQARQPRWRDWEAIAGFQEEPAKDVRGPPLARLDGEQAACP